MLKAGKAIGAGSVGCVFSPALRCKGDTQRQHNYVSKLLTVDNADRETRLLSEIHEVLRSIPSSEEYFVTEAHMCTPEPLSAEDLEGFNETCTNFRDARYNLEDYAIIQMPNAGLSIFDHASNGLGTNYIAFERLNIALMRLLQHGIVPMNKAGVFHMDIKEDNVVYDDRRARLIDWDRANTVNKSMNAAINRPVAFCLVEQQMARPLASALRGADPSKYNSIAQKIVRYITVLHGELLNGFFTYTFQRRDLTLKDALVDQIETALNTFVSDGNFNWAAYNAVVQHNYDIYGLIEVYAFVFYYFKEFFQVENKKLQECRNFLAKYMFSSDYLLDRYNVEEIINDLKALNSTPSSRKKKSVTRKRRSVKKSASRIKNRRSKAFKRR